MKESRQVYCFCESAAPSRMERNRSVSSGRKDGFDSSSLSLEILVGGPVLAPQTNTGHDGEGEEDAMLSSVLVQNVHRS